MPADEDLPYLVVDEENGLALPESYQQPDNGMTVRVPTTTIQIRANFPVGQTLPLVEPKHFDVENSRDPKNERLAPDRVELKKHGADSEAELFRVTLPISTP